MSVNASNIASALSVNASTSSSSSFNALGSSSGSANSNDKDKESLWYFTADQLINSPSRRHGIDIDQELSYRQMTAYLIQEMGQRLQVSQLCINTAIVYMHRFYAFHSFTHFHRNGIAAASLFLAAKVEEQPRKLEHVIKAANKCLNQPTSSTTDNYYLEQAQDLVFNENVLLQTLGFDVAIDHPHTHVVKTCHLVKACKDLAQTSYFLASNSLHLTSMCLQYKPTVVACFCIYLACKWSRWEIPQSTEGKHWFHYVDKTVTMDLLKQLTDEFIAIYEKSPARLKSKLNSIKALAQGASNRVVNKDKKGTPEEWKMVDMMKMYHSSINTSDTNNVNALTSNSFPASTPIDQQPQQQHQQNVQTALLPPPSNHSHQQIRRPESHSSQHRSHHSSSTSHHHSKQAFSTNDVPDHKASSSHKHYSSSASRPSRDHVQPTQNPSTAPPLLPPSSSAGASRGNLLASNSNSSRSVMSGGVTTQKLSSQSQETSLHKSRDRGGLPAILNSSSAFPTVHKLPQKPDTGRIGSKEHMNRVLSEQNKASNSKVFAPANVSQGGNNQLLSGSEISRNLIHQQHQRIHSSSGFNQPTMPRTSNSSSNSKHDPAMSVQMQSTAHKHPLSLDSQFTTLSSEQLQPSQSLYTGATGTALPPYSNTSKASEATHSGGGDPMDTDPTSQAYSSFLPMHGGFKPQIQQQTKISMFSPEWNEKMPQQQQNTSSSGSNSNNKPNAASTSGLNYRMHSSSSSHLESPKKIDRERNSNTPTKKERNRISYAGIDIAHQSSAATTTRPNIASQSTQKLQIQKKTDISNSNTAVLAGTSANAYSSIKRPNDNATIKHEDDLVRDSKMRKIDSVASTSIMGGVQSFTDTNKLQVVNGIETNPDLVRTLLKESLCTTNALIKNETPASIQTQSTITNSFQPTLQLLDPAVKVKEEKMPPPPTLPQSIEMDDTVAGSKTEKKKKKDKHKHKEKDKSKDREERKKHKKDKERHKDRETDYSEPVKIKISKEKLENTSSMTGGVSEPLGFKIKIPKERIISDLGCGGTGGSSNYGNISGDISNSAAPPPALKIKISKDKLENYSSGSSTSIDPTSFSNLHNQTGSMSNNIYGNSSSGALGGSSNSKKKDRERDRDREKEKKRNSLEYAKFNSNGSGAPAIGNASIIQTSTSSTKNSSSSKIQLYNNNMSQLFGESNDDEDDDDDKTTYQKTKKPSLLKTVNSTLSASAQNYHIPIKQNLDMSSNSDGNYNIQQQQHQQQYLAHQLANQQRQIYQKK